MITATSATSAPTIEFIFHGTGTSSSVPNISCITADPITCETCASTLGPDGQKNKRRNTGGILRVRSDSQNANKVIVIDVGKTFLSAAYDLFPRYGLRRIDAVVLTHPHADAMNGLDDLRGWTLGNSIQAHIDVYLSAFTLKEVQRSFPYLVAKEFATGGGDIPEFRWHIIKENEPFRVEGIDFDITPIVVHHGRLFSTEAEGNTLTPNDTPINSGAATPAQTQFKSGTPKSSVPSSQRNSTEISEQGNPISVEAVKMASLKLSPKQNSLARLTPLSQSPTAKPKPYLCFGFIFGNFMIYMSDVSHIPDNTWETIHSNSPSFDGPKDSGSSSALTTQTRRYKVLVVDCLKLEPHTSHFGIQGALDTAKRVNAYRTYMVGFSHRITHEDWNIIGEYLEGINPNDKQLERPSVVAAMRIVPQGGEPVWIRPAYDGLRLLGNEEEVWEDSL